VTDLVADTVYDGFGAEAYLCGPPPMIDAVTPILEAIGVEKVDIHADRFSPAKA
jgi:propane monooxygenase reductase subunit